MIDKTHRFKGHSSLAFVYRRGQTSRSAQFSLRYIINNRRQTYRAAVVVSRKVSKSAVTRNRIRRRFYEALRTESIHIEKPFDIVITVHSDQFATMPSDRLYAALAHELKAAGITTSPERLTDNRDIVIGQEK